MHLVSLPTARHVQKRPGCSHTTQEDVLLMQYRQPTLPMRPLQWGVADASDDQGVPKHLRTAVRPVPHRVNMPCGANPVTLNRPNSTKRERG